MIWRVTTFDSARSRGGIGESRMHRGLFGQPQLVNPTRASSEDFRRQPAATQHCINELASISSTVTLMSCVPFNVHANPLYKKCTPRSIRSSSNAMLMPILFTSFIKCARRPSRNLETIAGHTTPVLGDKVAARGLRVGCSGEEHALVAGGLFVFADAAGLAGISSAQIKRRAEHGRRVCAP